MKVFVVRIDSSGIHVDGAMRVEPSLTPYLLVKDWVRENGYHDLETLRELVGMGEISEDEIDSLYD